MSKQALIKAIELARGQVHLARGIRRIVPGSKVGQVHVWGWLNSVKMEVPPADMVLPIAESLGWLVTPNELRADLYPNPTDALPAEFALLVALGKWPPPPIAGDQTETEKVAA